MKHIADWALNIAAQRGASYSDARIADDRSRAGGSTWNLDPGRRLAAQRAPSLVQHLLRHRHAHRHFGSDAGETSSGPATLGT